LLNIADTTLASNTDINGNPRWVGAGIDLGPYEKQASDTISNNIGLSNEYNNIFPLLATCEENEWTYYSPSNNPDTVVFAIQWGVANALVKENAKVFINLNNNYSKASNDTNAAMATLARYWYININNDTLLAPVSIQFYYSMNDMDNLNIAFTNDNFDSVSTPKWFSLDMRYNPDTHLSHNNINNGNFNILTPSYDTVNGIVSVQFDSISTITSGTAYIQGTSELPNSIKEITHHAIYNLAPNPTKDILNINLTDKTYMGSKAQILDMQGRIIRTFEVKSNISIDCTSLSEGLYIIQIGGQHSKFVKQ
jgi:hypothetical protein